MKKLIITLILLTACATNQTGNSIVMTLPAINWGVKFQAENYSFGEHTSVKKSDTKDNFIGSNPQRSVNISGFLEEMPNVSSKEDCLKLYSSRTIMGMDIRGVNYEVEYGRKKHGNKILFTYFKELSKKSRHSNVLQYHINGYMYKNGHCVDMHIYKVYTGSKRSILLQIKKDDLIKVIDKVRIVKK